MTIDQLPTLLSPTGAEEVPVNYNGADYKLLVSSLMVGGAKFSIHNIAASGNLALTLENNSRGFLIVVGTNARGLVFLTCNGTGSTTNSATAAASSVTISTNTNTVTVTNGGTGAATALLITLAGTIGE